MARNNRTIDLKFQADKVQAELTYDGYHLEVNIEGAFQDDILECIDIGDAIQHYEYEKILDAIGQEKCEEYFDLIQDES